MMMKKFVQTWEESISYNKAMMYVLFVMVAINLLMVVTVLNKKEIVTIQPPNINSEATIGFDFASSSYVESWALL